MSKCGKYHQSLRLVHLTLVQFPIVKDGSLILWWAPHHCVMGMQQKSHTQLLDLFRPRGGMQSIPISFPFPVHETLLAFSKS